MNSGKHRRRNSHATLRESVVVTSFSFYARIRESGVVLVFMLYSTWEESYIVWDGFPCHFNLSYSCPYFIFHAPYPSGLVPIAIRGWDYPVFLVFTLCYCSIYTSPLYICKLHDDGPSRMVEGSPLHKTLVDYLVHYLNQVYVSLGEWEKDFY